MKNVKEYSKKIINLMIVLWFIGAAFGAIIIAVEIIATLAMVDGFSMAITIHLRNGWLTSARRSPVALLGISLSRQWKTKKKFESLTTHTTKTYHKEVLLWNGN